jgi:NADH-quinone oxidoreductase subunit K
MPFSYVTLYIQPYENRIDLSNSRECQWVINSVRIRFLKITSKKIHIVQSRQCVNYWMSMYGIPLSLILFLLATISMRTNRQSILLWFFAIELMLLRANLLFLTVSVMSDTLEGQLIAIYVLTVAAAESRIGLSLLVMYSRTRNTISLASFDRLKELSFF